MKEMDCVEVIVEKKEYVADGVHKGMQGWICDERNLDGYWLVNFPQLENHADIATAPIKEKDMRIIPVMYAAVNEEIRAKFEGKQE